METDMQKAVKKILSLTRSTTAITSDVLKEMMRNFLSGNAEKKGRISVRQLKNRAQENGGKLENIEISDQNIGDFLDTAKKYDIDFALKKDSGNGVFHVMFEAKTTDDFKRAFSEYAGGKQKEIVKKQPYTNREDLRKTAQMIRQNEPKNKEKVREKSKDMSL